MGLIFGENNRKSFYGEVKKGRGISSSLTTKPKVISSKKKLTRASCSILKSLGYKVKSSFSSCN